MIAAARYRQPFLAALLFQVTFCVAKLRQGNWLRGNQYHRGWGLKKPAEVSLSSESQTLAAHLLQFRGGSDYGGSGDWDGYSGGKGGYSGDDRFDWEKNDYQDDRDYSGRGRNADPYDDYDDRGRSPSRGNSGSPLASFQAKIKNGDRRLGVPLLGLGVVFTMLGLSLFFNKTLMRLGNLMIIAGVPTTIGPSRTAGYFFQPEKIRATACLGLGIFLVFVGWPIFGIALEVFGMLNLFGNMFPVFWAVFKNLPIVSSITKNSGGSGQRQSYDRERERDYRDDPYADDRQGYGDYSRDDDAEPYY